MKFLKGTFNLFLSIPVSKFKNINVYYIEI